MCLVRGENSCTSVERLKIAQNNNKTARKQRWLNDDLRPGQKKATIWTMMTR